MGIRFYNTLTHNLADFTPIEPPQVYMYNCGPTVYDYAHIGNFRTFMFADLLRRFLELSGYTVQQVMNITDVGHMTEDQLADGGGEDKMEAAARRLKDAKKQGVAPIDNPDDPYEVATFYTDRFIEDARTLGLKIADEFPAQMPRATEYIEQMQRMIARLLEKNNAYVASDGAVYFDVSTFSDYGKLSGNTLDKLRGGAGGRVLNEHQQGKRNPADFLLWKPDDTHIMKWDSPWGSGYPGWHIECSAMARAVLGREVIDSHTGGEDNIFPHHECEIAQSRGCTGEAHFARFWMHTRFLLVEGEKMSKSKGNFFTVRDVLEGRLTGRAVDPAVLRYELLRAPYRKNADFTKKGLEDAAGAVGRLRNLHAELKQTAGASQRGSGDSAVVDAFKEALGDDLNIAAALGEVFKWAGGKHDNAADSLAALEQIDMVLGVIGSADTGHAADDAAQRCAAMDFARANKDFATADAIRAELIEAGYDVLTTKDGTTAKKKLA